MTIPYPQACDAYGFSERRCAAVVADGISFAGLDEESVASIEFIPDPACGPQSDGTTILCNRSGGIAAYIRIRLLDGSVREQSVFCGVGSNSRLACTETPEIATGFPVGGGGYQDLPGDATPLPSVDPVAAAQAAPLEVATRSILIDHAGPYEVEVGQATLPNGLLTETRFHLADTAPDGVVIDPSGVWLDVRPTDPSRPPFLNKYERGWIDGVELVDVFLVFNVLELEPGSTLEVRDLVVR